MKTRRFFTASFLALSLSVLAFCNAQVAEKPFKPASGQAGKDVIWVPTAPALVDKMLDLAKVTSEDFVIDLGSGDGRTVIAAAKRGARGRGIEYNPDMVELSRRKAAEEGVSDKVEFVQADLFESDFSEATVITMFLLPQLNRQLRPKLLELEPGTRIVSNSFKMGDWEADESGEVTDGCGTYCTAYLWIVPANVAGTWRFPEGELKIEQEFQNFSGTVSNGRNSVAIEKGVIDGEQISFFAGGVQYVGEVKGDAIEGLIIAGGMPRGQWKAERSG